jgi:hypothetical protein
MVGKSCFDKCEVSGNEQKEDIHSQWSQPEQIGHARASHLWQRYIGTGQEAVRAKG